MKKIVLMYLACLALHTGLRAQGLAWAHSSSASYTIQPTDLAVDREGNLLLLCDLTVRPNDNVTTIDLDPGPGQHMIPANHALYGAMLKLDPHGKFMHAETYADGQNLTFLRKIAPARDGGYFILGTRHGFAPPSNPDANPAEGGVFLHRHRADGSLAWKKDWEGNCQALSDAIMEDAEGNVHLVIRAHAPTLLDPDATRPAAEGAGQESPAGPRLDVVHLNADGKFLGSDMLRHADGTSPWACAFSGSAVYYLESHRAEPALVLNESAQPAEKGYRLIRHDLMGGSERAYSLGSGYTTALTPDGKGGIWLAQGHRLKERKGDAAAFEDELASWKIHHFDADMNMRVKGHLGNAYAFQILNMAVDHAGDLYLSGHKLGPADLDPGQGVQESGAAPDATDMFILRMDPDAKLRWASVLPAHPQEVRQTQRTSRNLLGSLAVSEAGQVYALGVMSQVIDLDPGPGTQLTPPQEALNQGSWNFILSLNRCDAAPHQEASAFGSYYWPLSGQSYTSSGRYTAAALPDGCGSPATLDLQILSAPSEHTQAHDAHEASKKAARSRIAVYPNPTQGGTTLDLGHPRAAMITLSDLSGKVLMQQWHKDAQRVEIMLPYAKGTYILQVAGPDIHDVIRITKE